MLMFAVLMRAAPKSLLTVVRASWSRGEGLQVEVPAQSIPLRWYSLALRLATRITDQPSSDRTATAASVGASSLWMPSSSMVPEGGAISTTCPTRGTSGGALKSALYQVRKRCCARKRCCTISAHFGMNRMVSGNTQRATLLSKSS